MAMSQRNTAPAPPRSYFIGPPGSSLSTPSSSPGFPVDRTIMPTTQRAGPSMLRGPYFSEPVIEPPTRQDSPWATMTTPSPSPGPPPSPAVWMPHEWTPVKSAGVRPGPPVSTRSLPHLPGNHYPVGNKGDNVNSEPQGNEGGVHEMHELQALRTDTTFSPLPTHPEFLRNLHSHPMIIQRISDTESSRTPSPASSVEFVQQPPMGTSSNRNGKPVAAAKLPLSIGTGASMYSASPVPFPSDLRFASPSPANSVLSSPRPLPSIHGSQHSVRSIPSHSTRGPTPAASPDSAAALSSPRRNPIAMPRARVPAMPGATAVALGQARSADMPRHPVFYMQEGMVVLKVQESLYKIHRYLLDHHSDYFRRVVAESGDTLGRSDETPLPLPVDITQQAFDCLLEFLYHGIYDPASVSLSDWTTILRVSTRLQCTKVRQYSIRELTARRSSLPVIDMLVLAKEYDIPTWLGPAYAELVRQPGPLGEDDAERLGARVVARVARAREMLREEEYALFQQRKYGVKYVFPERPDEQLVARAVHEVFDLPAPPV